MKLQPRPKKPYAIPGLRIGESTLNILVGMAGLGKTTLAYAFAAYASSDGQNLPIPLFDNIPRSKTAIIDYEMTEEISDERMYAITSGESITVPNKPFYVEPLGIDATDLQEICRNHPLVIVDSLETFSQSVWNIDLNDPSISGRLKTIRSKLKEWKSTMLLIHHGAKTDNTSNRGVTSGAGFQGIINAAESVTVMRKFGKGLMLEQTKNTHDRPIDPIYYQQVWSDDTVSFSLSSAPISDYEDRILAILAESDEPLTRRAIETRLECKKRSSEPALRTLTKAGKVKMTKPGAYEKYEIAKEAVATLNTVLLMQAAEKAKIVT